MLNPIAFPVYGENEIIAFLTRRSGLLGGVCISGGEPLLQEDIIDFAALIKSAGFKIKLDTNGTCPHVLSALVKRDLLDYVAVDIKAPWEKYNRLAGVEVDYEAVKGTVALLRESGMDHEFRTTFVPGLLDKMDLIVIARELSGCYRYVIQNFNTNASLLDPNLSCTDVPARGDMEETAHFCRAYVNVVELRGF